MDFAQSKLTKTEWESIEVPVSEQESKILKLIIKGYYNIGIKENDGQSLLSYMKIQPTIEIEQYLYGKYFSPEVNTINKIYNSVGAGFSPKLPNIQKFKQPKKIDMMRLENMDANLKSSEFDKTKAFEFILLDFCHKLASALCQTGTNRNSQLQHYTHYLYTLLHMRNASIPHLNVYVTSFVISFTDHIQQRYVTKLLQETFSHSYTIIEKNSLLLKYDDKCLYDHQKQLFQLFRGRVGDEDVSTVPRKLVLYTAPTGTGKTMSPLGLSEGYRIIYICAARHIGLALAKSAISCRKRVAFAFGCEAAEDIRLHFFAASDYTVHRKSGGIFKVDHSNGEKVEIMICDIHSYIVAMHYMLAFNSEHEMIMYWDEPTIGLDVESHPLHSVIQHNWTENKIGNIVLSCATLPDESEIADTISDYQQRFGGNTTRVTSCDCKKSIAMLTPEGRATLPHLLFDSYEELYSCSQHLRHNQSLLRYLDLREIVRMIEHVVSVPGAIPEEYLIENYFMSVSDITMNRIKQYYLDVLCNISAEKYHSIHAYLKRTAEVPAIKCQHSFETVNSSKTPAPVANDGDSKLTRMFSVATTPPPSVTPSKFRGVLLTTEDAHTLTDGPTIYIAEDIQKLCQFYVHQSKIPDIVLQRLMEKVEANNVIAKKIEALTKSVEDALGTEVEKEKKCEREAFKPEVKRMMAGIEDLRNQIKMVSLNQEYVPNTKQHQQLWIRDSIDRMVPNAYTPMVDEIAVRKIIELDIDNTLKILLLMGIGIFETKLLTSKTPAIIKYLEIMKRLAYQQRLFLILASSDYIYGTNYQLCHGFLGKDLQRMTQQKIIQAMGRIGRTNIQQEYTIRFRDEALLRRLLLPSTEVNLEAINMNQFMVVTNQV